VELRFITLSEACYDGLGQDLPRSDTPGQALLNATQVFRLLEAVQADAKTNVMQAPKGTAFNGQRVALNVTDKQLFLAGVDTLRKDGHWALCPRNEPFTTGLQLSVQPAVSADRRFVQLKLKADLTSLDSAPVPLFPVVVPVQPSPEGGNAGGPVVFTQYLQPPKFNTPALGKTVKIPDGGTA